MKYAMEGQYININKEIKGGKCRGRRSRNPPSCNSPVHLCIQRTHLCILFKIPG